MKKLFKLIVVIAAISAVVTGILYWLKKQASDDAEDIFSDDFEDEDFNLDDDLGPVGREYVSLTPETGSDDSADISEDANTKINIEEE